jgi:Zn-dependent M28 family amino/carboxypeptidase
MKLSLIPILLFLGMGVFGQQPDSLKIESVKKVVDFLAGDEMRGRATGSEQEAQSADFIADDFLKIKSCKVKHQYFTIELDSLNLSSQNVIGFINNHKKKTILISAHYDHLGMGGPLSLSKKSNEVHNGADDNASGVALMLGLARTLAKENASFNFVFVAYSGHEIGLFGSKYFSENILKKHKSIALSINLDMVGRLGEDRKIYYECSSNLKTEIKSESELQLIKSTKERIGVLDTKWLMKKGIPSITFTTGMHNDYHKASDDLEYINFKGICQIEELLKNWILSYP